MENQIPMGSKKQVLKQQLLGAISMICIAAIALTGATYAWFTFVANPEIRDIDLYVKAADELYLSPYHAFLMDKEQTNYGQGAGGADPYNDPSLWFATITKDMIQTGAGLGATGSLAAQPDSFPIPAEGQSLKDVSSIFSTTNRNFFGRSLNDQGNPTAYVAAPALSDTGVDGGAYIKFDLWAKSTSNGVVYIDRQDLESSWVRAIDSFGAAGYTNTDLRKKYIENCVRIAFYTSSEGSAGISGETRKSIVH